MNREVLTLVEAIRREKGMEKEKIFCLLEEAISQAIQSITNTQQKPDVIIDREKGNIKITIDKQDIDPSTFGRNVYNKAIEIFQGSLSYAHSQDIFSRYKDKKGEIVLCSVLYVQNGDVFCSIDDNVKAVMPRKEQIPGETYFIGSKFKASILRIEKFLRKSRGRPIIETEIVVSRASPEFLKRLLLIEVPELSDGIIAIKKIVREPGYKAKVAVVSQHKNVSGLGSCIGIGGSRLKNITNELSGENIDVILWNDDPAKFIANAFKPAEVAEIHLNFKIKKARVYVAKEFLPQAIGKGGRNVRLVSELTGWQIDVEEIKAEQEK